MERTPGYKTQDVTLEVMVNGVRDMGLSITKKLKFDHQRYRSVGENG